MAEAHSKPSFSFRSPPRVGPANALQQIKMRYWHPKQKRDHILRELCYCVLWPPTIDSLSFVNKEIVFHRPNPPIIHNKY